MAFYLPKEGTNIWSDAIGNTQANAENPKIS